jgi:hypothetical protein
MSPEVRAVAEAGREAEEAFEESLHTPGTRENEAWHKDAMANMAQLKRDILTPGTPEHEAWFNIHGNTMRDFELAFGPFTKEDEARIRPSCPASPTTPAH